jgi:hypothetical protein
MNPRHEGKHPGITQIVCQIAAPPCREKDLLWRSIQNQILIQRDILVIAPKQIAKSAHWS